jgi:nitroimidazol reductase NimA-like FMN-containing flavoprotein (pyridoxamine 5'-phosphate oxidase superfamily)
MVQGGAERPTFLEVMSTEECVTELRRTAIGRVGFLVGGRPLVLPVNYESSPDATIVFRTAEHSVLINVHGQAVAFEIDGYDETARVGWSVCVQGDGREITQDPERDRPAGLTVISWAPGRRDRWFAITPGQVTGRRIPLDRATAFGWFPGIV